MQTLFVLFGGAGVAAWVVQQATGSIFTQIKALSVQAAKGLK
jgi:hypothetical protein